MDRYDRQSRLAGIGDDGHDQLAHARVLVVGAGGLGSPVLTGLVASGVGSAGALGLVDSDTVAVHNLARQWIHATEDVGEAKVDSAIRALRRTNPEVTVTAHGIHLDASNVARLIADYDLVVDCADNFAARYAIGTACVARGIPHVWGVALGWLGQVSVWAPTGPCLRCAFPTQPAPGAVPTAAEVGVLGAVCMSVAAAQVTETIKWLTGVGEPLVGRIMVHDARAASWDEVPVRRRSDCAVCGGG